MHNLWHLPLKEITLLRLIQAQSKPCSGPELSTLLKTSRASLYPTITRLLGRDWLRVEEQRVDSRVSGRVEERYYTPTQAGYDALRIAWQQLQLLAPDIDAEQ